MSMSMSMRKISLRYIINNLELFCVLTFIIYTTTFNVISYIFCQKLSRQTPASFSDVHPHNISMRHRYIFHHDF